MDTFIDQILRSQLGRRDFLRWAGIAGSAGVLAACRREARQAQPTGVARPPLEEEPGNLQVFEWSGYELKALWRPYAREFPDKEVKFSFFTTSPQALAKVRGGFNPDIVHPCNAYIPDFVKLGVVQPWDTSLLSNFDALAPGLVKAGQVDGKQYMVPLDWGFDAPMYRADEVDVDPGDVSWSLMFDERYPGKISWYDHPVENLVVAGWVHGFENPYEMTEEELDIVRAYLIEKKELVRFFWGSATDMENEFAAGNIWISYAWPDAWVRMKAKGLDVVYPEPKEGRMAWLCGLVLSADTPNYYHAHKFADAWASANTAEWLLINYAYGHPNTEIDFGNVDPELVTAFSLDDPSVLEEPRTHIDRYVPRRDLYSKIWDEVKAA